jgi:hypothetical protein
MKKKKTFRELVSKKTEGLPYVSPDILKMPSEWNEMFWVFDSMKANVPAEFDERFKDCGLAPEPIIDFSNVKPSSTMKCLDEENQVIVEQRESGRVDILSTV